MNAQPPEVRAHIERIANSAPFAESERLRRFLRFTVEAKLRGEHDRLKEYVLGREVFDRKDGYDPRLDPIVRVEARRLRSRLSDYYSGPGRAESIRIDYPKGTTFPFLQRAGSAFPPRNDAAFFLRAPSWRYPSWVFWAHMHIAQSPPNSRACSRFCRLNGFGPRSRDKTHRLSAFPKRWMPRLQIGILPGSSHGRSPLHAAMRCGRQVTPRSNSARRSSSRLACVRWTAES